MAGRRGQWCTLHLLLGAIALAAMVGPSCAALNEDQLHCEEAVAHLDECCPNFRADQLSCQHEEPAGCGCGREVDLDLSASEAVLALDCEELVASRRCEIKPVVAQCASTGGGL